MPVSLLPDDPGILQERAPGVPPPVPPSHRACAVDSSGSARPVSLRNVLVAVLAMLLLGVGGFAAYDHFGARWMKGAAVDPKRELRQRIQGQIAALRAKGRDLPPCPLLFPLLDRQQRVTPLGSYLSYLGMKRAAYLPEAVFRIPNAGEIFNSFELFSPERQPVQGMHRQELPLRFRAKDFAEGTWQETSGGIELSLRFWGTHPEKRVARRFAKGECYRAPEWIAASLHEWLGFQRTEMQSRYLDSPIYTCDEDLRRGAGLERLFRSHADLANGWDAIYEKNPGNALLFDRWLAVTEWRENLYHPAPVEQRFRKMPLDALLRQDFEAELVNAKRYEEAFNLLVEDLMTDGDNTLHYDWAVDVLQKMGCHEESIALLRAWCDKHPANQEAWMSLTYAYQDYAWVARGSGWASTVTKEGWRLMRERMAEAVKTATRATEVAPQDCRTWSTLMAMGTGARFSKEQMEGWFAKVLELNPYRYKTYSVYANYLKPKWFGSEEEVHAFLDKYADRFPQLIYDVVTEDFWDQEDEPRGEAGMRAKNAREAANVRRSPYLGTFRQRMEAYLASNPWDLKQWRDYLFWMVKIGQRDTTLAFAKETLAKAEPELKTLYPSLVLDTLRYESENLVNAKEVEAFENREDTMRLKHQALCDLVGADPANWTALNKLARFQVQHGQLKEAKATFERIDTHWVRTVWDKASFEKAKAAAA